MSAENMKLLAELFPDNFYARKKRFSWGIWLKCKFHAEGYVNNKYIFQTMQKAREAQWNPTFNHVAGESDLLRSFSLFHSLPSTSPDLNGLVKFFISTDEINLPPELELWSFFRLRY